MNKHETAVVIKDGQMVWVDRDVMQTLSLTPYQQISSPIFTMILRLHLANLTTELAIRKARG